MTHYADELTVSGAPLRDDELVAYLLADFDEDYNDVFTVVIARVDPISSSDLYAQLLSFEELISKPTSLLAPHCRPWSPIVVVVSLDTTPVARIGGAARVVVMAAPRVVMDSPLVAPSRNVRSA
jgi:hypothetical protein